MDGWCGGVDLWMDGVGGLIYGWMMRGVDLWMDGEGGLIYGWMMRGG